MAQARRRRHLSEDAAWERVRRFAEAHQRSEEPVYTLQQQVANTITDVRDDYIERRSAQTRTGEPSRISAAEVRRTWRALLENGHVLTAGRTVFTPALLRWALPELVSDFGNMISLRDFDPDHPGPSGPPSYVPPTRGGRSHAGDRDGRSEPRESKIHWDLKHYIHMRTEEALAGLPGGPWSETSLEFPLPTHDRIDVVARDGRHGMCLIEVKPYVGDRDQRWYAQAAKYRCVWGIIFPETKTVRCVLVAPRIEPELAAQMYRDFAIEALELSPPADFVAPPQPRDE